MGVYDKLSMAFGKQKRKLFDYQISLSGTEAKVVLLKLNNNKYKDEEVEIVKHFITDMIIDIPGEIPIDRLRTNVLVPRATTQSIFFYDVLPIQVFTKFEDNLERGDILIQRITMDNLEYYMVLEIADTLGDVLGRNIIYKKHNAAPCTQNLPAEVETILNTYKGLDNKSDSTLLNSINIVTTQYDPTITGEANVSLSSQTSNITTNTITAKSILSVGLNSQDIEIESYQIT